MWNSADMEGGVAQEVEWLSGNQKVTGWIPAFIRLAACMAAGSIDGCASEGGDNVKRFESRKVERCYGGSPLTNKYTVRNKSVWRFIFWLGLDIQNTKHKQSTNTTVGPLHTALHV